MMEKKEEENSPLDKIWSEATARRTPVGAKVEAEHLMAA